MYKHRKRGDAVIIDPMGGIVNWTPQSNQIRHVSKNGTPKPEHSVQCDIATNATLSLAAGAYTGCAVTLPPVGVRTNIALTFSGTCHFRFEEGTGSDINTSTVFPFVALYDTIDSNLGLVSDSICKIPVDAKYQNYASVNKTVILKDCGNGLDLSTHGVAVGWYIYNTYNAETLRRVSASIYTRYNYAPITLLDQEN